MNLLPDGLAKTLPAYGAQEKLSLDDHVMHVAYFSIISNWHWYACEYDPITKTFFGYVMGMENEWGDFSLFEMKECTFAGGVPAIERDLYFKPCTFAELLKRVGGSNG